MGLSGAAGRVLANESLDGRLVAPGQWGKARLVAVDCRLREPQEHLANVLLAVQTTPESRSDEPLPDAWQPPPAA